MNPEQPRKHGMMGTRQAVRSSRQIPGADRRDPTLEWMRYEEQLAEWYETGKSPYPWQKPYWREPETRVSRVRGVMQEAIYRMRAAWFILRGGEPWEY